MYQLVSCESEEGGAEGSKEGDEAEGEGVETDGEAAGFGKRTEVG